MLTAIQRFREDDGTWCALGERTTRGVALAGLEDGHREDLFVPVRPALVSPHRAQETRLEDPGLGRPFSVVAEPPTNLVQKGTDGKDNVPGRPDEMVHERRVRPGPPRDGGVRLPLLGNPTRAVSDNVSHEKGRFGLRSRGGRNCWDPELVCRRACLQTQFRTGMLLRGHLSTS